MSSSNEVNPHSEPPPHSSYNNFNTSTEPVNRKPCRMSTPPPEQVEVCRQLLVLALRVRDLLVLADTSTVASWQLIDLEASWQMVVRFRQEFSQLSAAQHCTLCVKLRKHLKPTSYDCGESSSSPSSSSSSSTVEHPRPVTNDQKNTISIDDPTNNVTFCELAQADKTLHRRLSANEHLNCKLYDRLQSLRQTSAEQFRDAALPAGVADWIAHFQAEMLVGFSDIYEQANCLAQNVKQRALMLDLEYNLSQRTSSRRVSATMLAGRLLTEHRVQLAALADLTESNGNNLDELRCNVTLDGFMQKLGRLLDHSPGILEIILMTIAIGDADCITKERTSKYRHYENLSTLPADKKDVDGKAECVKHSCITEVTTHLSNTLLCSSSILSNKSLTCKEAKQQMDWRVCRQQLLDWLLARPCTYVNRLYYLHPALLAEVAEYRLPFADVYSKYLLQLTSAQLKVQQQHQPNSSSDRASIPPITPANYMLPRRVSPIESTTLKHISLCDYWCCLVSRGAQMRQLIRKHFQQLCTFVTETSDSGNNNSNHHITSEPLDETAKKSLKQYLVKFGIEL